MRWPSRLAVAGVLCTVSAILAARTPSQQQPFRAVSDLIQVDVSVLDRQRRAVSGLTAGDFTLRENGVEQTIHGPSDSRVQ